MRRDASGELIMYYDRQGRPLTDAEWTRLYGDEAYRRVALDRLRNGIEVSTVWLGLDHGWGDAVLVFETMAFGPASWGEIETDRYTTEEEALAGHRAIVRHWRSAGRPIKKRVLRKKLARREEDRRKVQRQMRDFMRDKLPRLVPGSPPYPGRPPKRPKRTHLRGRNVIALRGPPCL